MWHYHHIYYLATHWGLWLFLLLLVIWFIIPNEVPNNKMPKEGILFLLKNRLAKGQIGVKEYQEKKAILKKK
ncbi:MAG: hypothetical protein JWQ63_3326 [Mucilaginibacter sp.]|nr:hypothetical protein [Mucilaginibacter sp.]